MVHQINCLEVESHLGVMDCVLIDLMQNHLEADIHIQLFFSSHIAMTCQSSISIAAGVCGSRCNFLSMYCWQLVTESELENFACLQCNFSSQGVFWGWIPFKIDIFCLCRACPGHSHTPLPHYQLPVVRPQHEADDCTCEGFPPTATQICPPT